MSKQTRKIVSSSVVVLWRDNMAIVNKLIEYDKGKPDILFLDSRGEWINRNEAEKGTNLNLVLPLVRQ